MSIYGPNFTSQSTKYKDPFERKKTSFGKITVDRGEEAEGLTLFDDTETPVVIYWSHQNKQPLFVFCLLHSDEELTTEVRDHDACTLGIDDRVFFAQGEEMFVRTRSANRPSDIIFSL